MDGDDGGDFESEMMRQMQEMMKQQELARFLHSNAAGPTASALLRHAHGTRMASADQEKAAEELRSLAAQCSDEEIEWVALMAKKHEFPCLPTLLEVVEERKVETVEAVAEADRMILTGVALLALAAGGWWYFKSSRATEQHDIGTQSTVVTLCLSLSLPLSALN